MTEFQRDFSFWVIANLFNLMTALVFLARIKSRDVLEWWTGLAMILLILPIGFIAVRNLQSDRPWWSWVLPLIPILYLLVECGLDYILRIPFRSTALLGPYLALFYLALFAMIGYSFLVGRIYGAVTLGTYFIQLAASLIAYHRVGH